MNPIYNPKNRDFSSCVAFTLVTLLVFATAASTSITFADKSADRSGAADEKNNKGADSNIDEKKAEKAQEKTEKKAEKDDNDSTPSSDKVSTVSMSVETPTQKEVITFSTEAGWFSDYSRVDVESLPPNLGRPSADMLFGLFAFTISGLTPGATVGVTITFPSDIPAGSQYWKLQDSTWFQLPIELVGDNDGDNILTLTLTDGGIGDDDSLVNGIIVDPGGPASVSVGKFEGCRTMAFTNDTKAYTRCTVIDTEPPKILKAFVTPNDYLCVQVIDNTQIVKVSYNGKEIPVWPGSSENFCTNEEFPPVIKVVAEDVAGNKSEKISVDASKIARTTAEQTFNAVVTKDLNPHHGVEGITLETSQHMKQIKLAISPEFSDRELYVSEKGLRELDGKQTISVTYEGKYEKERHGYLYVFGTNKGLLATFDIVVKDDIKLYPHQGKESHGSYSLDLQSISVLDKMNLNAWQKVELESIFAGSEELTITHQNMLSMVLRLMYNL